MPSKRFERELVKGFLHEPVKPLGAALAIAHGAGGNCEAPLLRAIAEELSAAGFYVLRYDLPYRQTRPKGPPFPAQAARDRDGIRAAAEAMRSLSERVYLGGHSYGGRQTTMAAAENPGLAQALLLLSYPLHPPGKQDRPRTEHFPNLRVPSIFFHGSRDSFGTMEELSAALGLIPARTELVEIAGAPHGLPASAENVVASRFLHFILDKDDLAAS